MLSQLCTCDGHLVPGTVCSPVISNFVFLECDKALHQMANDHDCSYSRYVDDITFSGDKTPRLRKIDDTLESFGFSRNIDKTYLQTRGKRQYVTGLTVFDKSIPRIPKQLKKKFRSYIYYMRNHGITGHLKMINSTELTRVAQTRIRQLNFSVEC